MASPLSIVPAVAVSPDQTVAVVGSFTNNMTFGPSRVHARSCPKRRSTVAASEEHGRGERENLFGRIVGVGITNFREAREGETGLVDGAEHETGEAPHGNTWVRSG